MRTIHLRVDIPSVDPATAFDQISDFTRFPSLAKDVHDVETKPGSPRHSDWEVNFRRGLMRWTEQETLDTQALSIEFHQTDGDFEDFRGHWQLARVPEGTEVYFEVTYDFGIESLVGIMDPIAERVIKRAIFSVLEGLFGGITIREGEEALHDLDETAHTSNRPPTGGR
ncbi:type II toxin-antitoxin system RatA family toxin [Streptomyces olivaceoviridis]|uniref:type II toxin-antitoxin system RatA family toxin n=1 Tax=Streptomyces olivaceoviridis TaxID=1921 RepID=UPI0036F7884E